MSKQTEKDPSNQDILKSINDFADEIERRFATKEDLQVLATKKDLTTIEQRLTGVEHKLTGLEVTLVEHGDKIGALHNKMTTLEGKLVTRLDRILVNTERLETERVAHVAWLQRHDQLFKKLLPQD